MPLRSVLPARKVQPVRTPTSRQRAGRRLAALLAGAGLALLGLAAIPDGPASATSAIGGVITTNEVMQRAADWYDRAPTYSGSTTIWDLGQTRQYRTDCSGFIDMALHLNGDYNTSDFANSNNSSLFADVGPASSSLTTADVRPGDIFDDTADSHAFLFEGWAADGVHISYYTFGGPGAPEHHQNETFSQSTLAYLPTSHYHIYRYRNLVYSDPSNSGAVVGASDWQHIFVTSNTDSVAQRYGSGSNWAWGDIGGTVLVGAPAVNYYPDTNEYDVYATGSNGHLYVKEYRNNTWDCCWTLISGPLLTQGVSAMIDKYGHQHLFGSGQDGAVYNIRNATAGPDGKNGSWTFYSVGGTVLVGAVGVNYFPSTNEYDVYAVGTDGHLYEKDYINDSWACCWSDRGYHSLALGVAAMVDKYGHQHVFAVTRAGSLATARNTSGNSWTWDDLGGTVLTSTPKLLYDYDSNTYNVWAVGSAVLWHKEYADGTWWPTWHNFSGTTTIGADG